VGEGEGVGGKGGGREEMGELREEGEGRSLCQGIVANKTDHCAEGQKTGVGLGRGGK